MREGRGKGEDGEQRNGMGKGGEGKVEGVRSMKLKSLVSHSTRQYIPGCSIPGNGRCDHLQRSPRSTRGTPGM